MKAESVCIPEKYKILSGSVLKCIALFTMIVDHVGLHLLRNSGIVLMHTSAGPLELFTLMRKVGRLAFPIYCFLLVEGFLHTHDRRKYGLNLLAFALISEIPWNLEHTGALHCSSQNVFFTLFLGYAGMCCIEELKERPLEQLISLIALVLVAMNLKADYGIGGFAFILVMYLLREQKIQSVQRPARLHPRKSHEVSFLCCVSGAYPDNLPDQEKVHRLLTTAV